MSTLGMLVALRTRKPACRTPRFLRPAASNPRCISVAKAMLCAMFLFCIMSNMMYDSEERGLKFS